MGILQCYYHCHLLDGQWKELGINLVEWLHCSLLNRLLNEPCQQMHEKILIRSSLHPRKMFLGWCCSDSATQNYMYIFSSSCAVIFVQSSSNMTLVNTQQWEIAHYRFLTSSSKGMNMTRWLARTDCCTNYIIQVSICVDVSGVHFTILPTNLITSGLWKMADNHFTRFAVCIFLCTLKTSITTFTALVSLWTKKSSGKQ